MCTARMMEQLTIDLSNVNSSPSEQKTIAIPPYQLPIEIKNYSSLRNEHLIAPVYHSRLLSFHIG
jgi:hypothetical protein